MEKGGKLIMRKYQKASAKQIMRFFAILYKGKSAKSSGNALAKSLRNACEKIVYNKFQVYSLQI